VIDELLEGVYNNGEVMWLETKWLILSLLRSRKYEYVLDELNWMVVIPDRMMLQYVDFRGTLTWKYKIKNGNKIILYKGWKNRTKQFPGDDVEHILVELHEKLAYEEIDKIIS
jgi:hypothetical protein